MAAEVTLKDFLEELADQRSFDFRGYKKSTLERRFRRRMFQLSLDSYAKYSEYIRKHPDEVNQLLNTILINVTEFFRDPPAWEILRHEVLPSILKRVKPGHSFRAWSAGCASGEEPYSIAILLAEYFGSHVQEYDIKIYATDIDEEALNAARRGEYSEEAIRRVRPEWRQKFFHGKGLMRVSREIRRLVIFGRSNLAQDAPISNVNLLVCRNLLIYFDPDLQKQILNRLHYALKPGGVLFLGKSESQLTNSPLFQRANARWRIFQRKSNTQAPDERATFASDQADLDTAQRASQLDSTRQQNRYMLETLRAGIFILGSEDTVQQHNNAALTLCALPAGNVIGRRLADTDLLLRIPELSGHLHATRANNESVRFQSHIRAGNEDTLLDFTLRPIIDERGVRTGTLIYIDDQTVQEKLQSTVEELESTSEELQSANEELETTNEELQSTNEELETTNEELQSTNEELETTNEELQSLNEELETTNQELEDRTKELDQVNSVYAQTLEKMRVPILLINQERQIQFWNTTALRLFGFKSKPPVDLNVDQLPISRGLKDLLIRRHRAVLLKEQPIVSRAQRIFDNLNSVADIHFSVVPGEDKGKDVLIMFEPRNSDKAPRHTQKKSKRRN
jgi:two-component system CheB/CheR fusion protein